MSAVSGLKAAGVRLLSAAIIAGLLADAAFAQVPESLLPQAAGKRPAATATTPAPAATWALPGPVWDAWRAAFLDKSGRVVDTANNNISHSEGQGYGLLLAVYANDWATFEQIWTFTLTELLIRDDGLAAWKWDPRHTPHVVDINNATDGDILIAWALSLAADQWKETRYRDAATRIANAIGQNTFRSLAGYTLILPGVAGFDHTADGGPMVVNPSYWIFQALPVLAKLAPDYDWAGAEKSGVTILTKAQFSRYRLPSDWLSISPGGVIEPATGFDPLFGYNSLRIPLYLLASGHTDERLLGPYQKAWTQDGENAPLIVNVQTGKVIEKLTEPGYQIQAALVSCALSGTAIPYDLREFVPTSYYASTLHLLAMTVLARRYAKCL